jgi:hypothetical protein
MKFDSIGQLRKFFLPSAFLFLCLPGFAQERKIIGRIVDDETQKGMSDVHIIKLGKSDGATSNALGYFELTVDSIKDYILVISHVGYATSRVEIPKADRFKFSLKKEEKFLGRIELTDYPKKPAEFNSKNKTSKKSTSEKRRLPDGTIEELKVVESNVVFPGSLEQFLDGLGNSISSSVGSLKKDVLLSFTVSDSGKVSNFALNDSFPEMDVGVRNFFQHIPACTPATQRGKNVPQQFAVEIGSMTTLNRFYKFMSEKIKYPLQARRMGIEGIVWVQFEISPEGYMNLPIITKDIQADCGIEVMNALKAVPQEILAGMACTSATRKLVLPVTFGLDGPFAAKAPNFGPEITVLHIINVIAFGSAPRR